jgi:protein O-mannosyl-transferase
MENKINISPNKQKLIFYIILTVVTLAIYWQVNQFDFINVDDQTFITQNRYVQYGITLDGIRWAFSTTYAGFWHPLTWLSFMFDYQLYGMNAMGYHITNVIFHILSALLLFWLFNRMTQDIWKSAFVAALFALHPLHVESVAWIAERKDVLSAFFWMLTLCMYVHYTEKPAVRRYLLVLFFFACALMSKSMVVTLPVVMILLDYWPLKRFELKKSHLLLWQLKEKMPFFILSTVFSITMLFIWHDPSGKDFPLASRIANAPVAFITYLEKIFWPHNMHFFHYFSNRLPTWHVLGATLLILFITAAVMIMVRRSPYLFVGWFWYVITILPVLGFMKNGIVWMHDHYVYLPSIGIGIILAWGVPSLNQIIRKNILLPAGTVVLAILAVVTWHQCSYWKNSISLFSHDLQVTKNNSLAHNFLGYSLFKKGKIGESIYHYNKAILTAPDYASSYNNRGNAYAKLGQNKLAIDDYTKAISLNGDYYEAYFSRGTVYGKLLGQYKLAADDFSEAIRLNPDYIDAYNNRGIVLDKLGLYQKAIDDFNEAIRLKPDYANALNNRAFSYLNLGNTEFGCSDAKKSCKLGNCNTLEVAKGKGYCR